MSVIYENPAAPLPEWARWMAKDADGLIWVFEHEPDRDDSEVYEWLSPFVSDEAPESYTIPGPWQDSLRRIIRLSEPQYYVPENLHTDAEGFLPHDGGAMPEWCRGKTVEYVYHGGITAVEPYAAGHEPCWSYVTAYRIVGDGSEGRGAGEPDPTPMLLADNRAMRRAGNALAEAAIRVAREYDGTHRLMLAASEWCRVVADEGGRGPMPDQENDR